MSKVHNFDTYYAIDPQRNDPEAKKWRTLRKKVNASARIKSGPMDTYVASLVFGGK